MLACPRCNQPISQTAINCPNCKLGLKAHGHPGITLHRADGAQPLCASCAYDADDSCTFPQRPDAMTCTLYQNVNASSSPLVAEAYRPPLKAWWRGNIVWVALAILIVTSVAIALLPVIL